MQMPTNESLANVLMKDWESKSLAEIIKGPPSVLQGLSEGDAQKLKEAFGIDTVEELAKNRFVLWAQALVTLAAQEK
jgi:predicted RecB family nuclease